MNPRSRPAHKDMEHPPGQRANPVQNTDKTLADYIERKEIAMQVIDAPKKETVEDAYLRGYDEGIAEGFQRGIIWIRGK